MSSEILRPAQTPGSDPHYTSNQGWPTYICSTWLWTLIARIRIQIWSWEKIVGVRRGQVFELLGHRGVLVGRQLQLADPSASRRRAAPAARGAIVQIVDRHWSTAGTAGHVLRRGVRLNVSRFVARARCISWHCDFTLTMRDLSCDASNGRGGAIVVSLPTAGVTDESSESQRSLAAPARSITQGILSEKV